MSDLPPGWEVHTRNSRFREERYENIEVRSYPWLFKYVAPQIGVGIIAGPSRGGKTFVASDIALRKSCGMPVLGRDTTAGAVLYIAAEDANGLRLRTEAWRLRHGQRTAPFSLIGDAPELLNDADFEDLEATIDGIAAAREEQGVRLEMIVVDTLAQSIAGADENSAADMSRVLQRMQRLAQRLKLFVLIVAHTGKDETRGIRGWSGLLGNADTVLMVERDIETDQRTLIIDKVKNAGDGRRHPFALLPVDITTDDDGDPVRSMVVDFIDDEPVRRRSKVGQTDRDRFVLTRLKELIEAGQTELVPPLAGVPAQQRGVLRERLKEDLRDSGYGAPDEEWETKKRRINRDVERLINQGLVRATPEVIWLIK